MVNPIMRIKWERVIGLIALLFVLVFIWRHSFFITSKEAFINADVRNICSPIFGQLDMQRLEPGIDLKRGEILFEVHNPRVGELQIYTEHYALKQRIESMSTDIRQDNISIAKLKADLIRNKELEKIGAVSKETIRNILYEINILRIGVKSKEELLIELKESEEGISAQLKLYENGSVNMPVNGVIWAVFRKNGDFVKVADTVLQVIDTDHIWVDAFFQEKDAKHLSLGSVVTVLSSDSKKKWEGKVIFVRKGRFSDDDISTLSNVAHPKKRDEEHIVSARIDVKWDTAYSPLDFYGYGKSVKVLANRGLSFSRLLVKNQN